jgi:probable rRNA maturation factor
MINVETQIHLPIDLGLIKTAARRALESTPAEEGADLTIVIGDDELMRHCNQQFLGIDAPTDVLSFPVDYTDAETNTRYLGDILISLLRAQEQATVGGHTLTEELQLLVVHGVLHLLGFDHAEHPEKARMQAAQDRVMAELGSQVSPSL